MLSKEDCLLVAQCPSVKELAEVPFGKQLHVVLLAYLAAFAPWTLLPLVLSLVGPEKPPGLFSFLLFYLMWCCSGIFVGRYIVAQAHAKDYSEMSAAIVALVVGTIEYSRQNWVSHTMRRYHKWVSKSLKSLARFGYFNGSDSNGQNASPDNDSFTSTSNVQNRIDAYLKKVRLNRKTIEATLPYTLRARYDFLYRAKTVIHWMAWFLSAHGSKWLEVSSVGAEATQAGATTISAQWEQHISRQNWAREALRRHGATPPADDPSTVAVADNRRKAFRAAMISGLGLPWNGRFVPVINVLIGEPGLSTFRSHISAAIGSELPEMFRNATSEAQERMSSITETELEWFVIFLEYAAFREEQAGSLPADVVVD